MSYPETRSTLQAGTGDPSSFEDAAATRTQMAEVGRRLRHVRVSLGLSLNRVAERTGLTKGFLSQLERGETSVSIANLLRICSVLHIELGRLFETRSRNDRPLVRREEKAIGFLNGDGVMEFQLTPASEHRFEVCEARIAAGGSYGHDLYSLDVDIGFVYVLAGEVEAEFPDRTLRLRQGDALTFTPREPHTFRNPSHETETVLLFFKSPALVQSQASIEGP